MAKPIVLTKENVLANMAGRKTKTRRIINPQPPCSLSRIEGTNLWTFTNSRQDEVWKPKFQVGDEVYVAEGYAICEVIQGTTLAKGNYLADFESFEIELTDSEWRKWANRTYPYRGMSGRFMYKSLARTFMTITEVRVERLQDISEEDAHAEGIYDTGREVRQAGRLVMEYPSYQKAIRCTSACSSFSTLWDSIHGTGSWEMNPWVWVYKWEKK